MSMPLYLLLEEITYALKQGGIQNSRKQGYLILTHVLGCPLEQVVLHSESLVDDQKKKMVKAAVQRYLQGEPLSRIFQYREFWSLPFVLNSATLDPRPDSETLIEAVLKQYPDHTKALRILDLGTGSGCLLLSLLHEYKNATGVGTDIQPLAIAAAQQNAENLKLKERAIFVQTSWTQDISGSFDIIISNPPYITEPDFKTLDPIVKTYDPKVSLVGGEDGLMCYREIAQIMPFFLHSKGILVLEIGQGQKQSIQDIFKATSFQIIATHQDLAGIERALVLQGSTSSTV